VRGREREGEGVKGKKIDGEKDNLRGIERCKMQRDCENERETDRDR
jgi:hypothetical protein